MRQDVTCGATEQLFAQRRVSESAHHQKVGLELMRLLQDGSTRIGGCCLKAAMGRPDTVPGKEGHGIECRFVRTIVRALAIQQYHLMRRDDQR